MSRTSPRSAWSPRSPIESSFPVGVQQLHWRPSTAPWSEPPRPALTATCLCRSTSVADEVPVDGRTRELQREYRAVVEEILELRGADHRIAEWLRAISEPGALADSCGYSPDLDYESRLSLLRTVDVTERLELAVRLQRERLAELQIRKRIRDDVQEGADKQQREYFLRKQMESIRKELGEDDASLADEYRTKIEAAEMPEAVKEQALKELGTARADG